MSYNESAWQDLGSIDLLSSEFSESSADASDGWDGLPDTAAWDALEKNFTNLQADMTQMKEMEPVDPEVNTMHIFYLCIHISVV